MFNLFVISKFKQIIKQTKHTGTKNTLIIIENKTFFPENHFEKSF